MDDEIREYLRLLVEADGEHNADHLAWLRSADAATEPDRDQQVAETERAVELANKATIALDTNKRDDAIMHQQGELK